MDTTDEVSATCTVPLHCTADIIGEADTGDVVTGKGCQAARMAQPRPTLAGLRVAGLRVGLVPQSA